MIVEGIVTVADELIKLSEMMTIEGVETVLRTGFKEGEIRWFFAEIGEDGYIIVIDRNVPIERLRETDANIKTRWTFVDGDPATQSVITSVYYLLNGQHFVTKEGIPKYAEGWGKPLDMLYIDGNHDALGPMRDYVNYAPLVRPGGLVVFADLNYPNVLRIYKELLDELKPEHWELIATENHDIISHGVGIIKLPSK